MVLCFLSGQNCPCLIVGKFVSFRYVFYEDGVRGQNVQVPTVYQILFPLYFSNSCPSV